MNKQRPVNLDLGTLAFPPMAIASILHRISGIILFVMMPFIFYLLELSLRSAESYAQCQRLLANPLVTVLLWGFMSALIYHVLAGLRHILMDFGFGETVEKSRASALSVMALAVILILLTGIWLW